VDELGKADLNGKRIVENVVRPKGDKVFNGSCGGEKPGQTAFRWLSLSDPRTPPNDSETKRAWRVRP